MEDLLLEYLPILIFMGLSLVVGLALLIAPFIIAPSKPDPEKLAAYECGFDAFDDARMKFDVKYYLVAILFIITNLTITNLIHRGGRRDNRGEGGRGSGEERSSLDNFNWSRP